jgi:hypothetical protein
VEQGPSRPHVRRVLLAGISVFILVSTACTSLGIMRTETDADLAATIEAQKRIRVLTSTEETQILRPTARADGVEGRAPGSGRSIRFSWAAIQEIQVRKRGSRRGLWVGSGLGFAAGLAAGAILVHESKGGSLELTDVTILIGSVGGCAVGALTGALVGSLFNGWKTVYAANGRSRPVPAFSLAPARGGGLAATFAVGF